MPYGLSWITKTAIGGLCAMLALGAAALVLASKSDPLPPSMNAQSAPQSDSPSPAASPASAATDSLPAPEGRVLVKQVIELVGAQAGKQCEAMAGEPQSCRFLATDTFPFMVKVVAETAPIAPQSLIEQLVVMFPVRLQEEQQAAAMVLMLSMASVADVPLSDKRFYTQLVTPGHRTAHAQSGGTSKIDVEGSPVFHLATVTRPH